jgi:negative regulator of sigma E activity
MMKSIWLKWLSLTMVLGAMVLSSRAIAAEFSADMIQKMDNQVTTSKFFQKGQKTRNEFKNEDGKVVATIVDLEAKKTVQLVPSEKVCMEIPLGGEFAAWAADQKTQEQFYDMKLVGTETINGYVCDKYTLTPKKAGLEKMTTWNAKNLGCPIKTVSEGYSMELQNIKEGKLDDGLFTVPQGYKRMSMDDMMDMEEE